MDKFIKSNAIASLIINVVINIAIPFFILRNETVVYLKEGSAVLLPNIMGAVIMSTFMTTLITFFLMTQKRKIGDINLPIRPEAPWFLRALLEGIALSFCLAVFAFGILTIFQNNLGNIAFSVNTVLLISGIIGGVIGVATSFIAANRASKIA